MPPPLTSSERACVFALTRSNRSVSRRVVKDTVGGCGAACGLLPDQYSRKPAVSELMTVSKGALYLRQ